MRERRRLAKPLIVYVRLDFPTMNSFHYADAILTRDSVLRVFAARARECAASRPRARGHHVAAGT
eukprot:8585013-Pyramimonas_sp.AAC.1